MTSKLPTYAELLGPTLRVLRDLGGSGSIDEVNDGISQMTGATQEQLDQTYPKSGGPILTDRMSWARSWLKAPGYISNPSRGVWVLELIGREVADKSTAELKKLVLAHTGPRSPLRRLLRTQMTRGSSRTQPQRQRGAIIFCLGFRHSTRPPLSAFASAF